MDHGLLSVRLASGTGPPASLGRQPQASPLPPPLALRLPCPAACAACLRYHPTLPPTPTASTPGLCACSVGDVGLGRYALYFAAYMTSVEFCVYWCHRILHSGVGYKCVARLEGRLELRLGAQPAARRSPSRGGLSSTAALVVASTSRKRRAHTARADAPAPPPLPAPPCSDSQVAARDPPQVQQGRPDEPLCRAGLPPPGRHLPGELPAGRARAAACWACILVHVLGASWVQPRCRCGLARCGGAWQHGWRHSCSMPQPRSLSQTAAAPRAPLAHQALPYSWTLFYVPMHFLTHEMLLFFTSIWTTNIHDNIHAKARPCVLVCFESQGTLNPTSPAVGIWSGDRGLRLQLLPPPPLLTAARHPPPAALQIAPVMGAGYHTIHHTLYNYNYGHYFTFVDR